MPSFSAISSALYLRLFFSPRRITSSPIFTSGIFVKKETNTRYNVYNLSTSQMNMLKILAQQNITIPEYGK